MSLRELVVGGLFLLVVRLLVSALRDERKPQEQAIVSKGETQKKDVEREGSTRTIYSWRARIKEGAMTELGRLAVLVLCVAALLYVVGHFAVTYWQPKEDRFVHVGGRDNPYVMFDEKTGQACYAGSLNPEDRIRAARQQTGTAASPGTPLPPSQSGRVPGSPKKVETPDEEIQRLARELGGKKPEIKEPSELSELPTCRSLL